MEMTERQLIQEILNTVDILYDFEDVDEDKKDYILVLHRQDNDKRSVEQINSEMKHYFKDAGFTYDEQLNPSEGTDIKVEIQRS